MKSLEYLKEIKKEHILDNDELIDIIEKIGYIARDNGMDDTITESLIELLSE